MSANAAQDFISILQTLHFRLRRRVGNKQPFAPPKSRLQNDARDDHGRGLRDSICAGAFLLPSPKRPDTHRLQWPSAQI